MKENRPSTLLAPDRGWIGAGLIYCRYLQALIVTALAQSALPDASISLWGSMKGDYSTTVAVELPVAEVELKA